MLDGRAHSVEEREVGRSLPEPASLPWNRLDTLVAGLEALLVVLVYARTLRFEFVLDDIPLILKNPLVFVPWRTVPRFFAEGYFDRIFPGSPANDYRPLLSVWLLVNQRLWGFNPAGWHLTGLLLLALVTLGVYVLGRRITHDRKMAAIASMLFALHPIHVECTAWVIGTNEALMAALFVASFLAYLAAARSRDGQRQRSPRGSFLDVQAGSLWRAASLAFYALALLAKEEAVVLPVLVAGFAWVYGRPDGNSRSLGFWARTGTALLGTAPYWALTAAYLALRFEILHGLIHTATEVPFRALLETVPLVLWRDIRLLLWPSGLTIFYESPYVSAPTDSSFLLPLAAVLALVAGLVAWGRRSRAVRFAAIWTIVPVLPLLDLRVLPDGEFIHDRYLYLSSIGFSLLLAIAVSEIARLLRSRVKPARVELVAAIILGSTYGGLTFYYSGFWANELTLSQRVITVSPESNFALVHFAYEDTERGRCDVAAAIYQKVLARSPRYWLAYFNLGVCHYKTGQYDMALNDLGQASEIAPGEPDVYFYIGLAQYRLGRLAVAETALRRAIDFRPEGAGYHLALGVVLEAEDEKAEALAEFRKELAYRPEQLAARRSIAELESQTP